MKITADSSTASEPTSPRSARRRRPRSAEAAATTLLDAAGHRVHLLREMLRIRRFEERCVELYSATKIRGFMHLYIGEEAVAVGVLGSLREDDAVVSTYREHGHALARGIAMDAVMAEMFGRATGCSRGRGGSMHLFDAARRFYGGNAIVAGGLPLALGLALSDRMLDRDRVTACFFGDGAFAEGEFHESINLAALWRAPLLLVCENNRYAMGTALATTHARTDLAARAGSYGVEAHAVDGMDVEAVERATREALAAIHADGTPRFLEMLTYRFRAHSMYDADRYRDKAEIQRWRRRDPLTVLERRMRDAGELDDAGLAALEDAVGREIAAAVETADAAPEEPVEDLMRYVLATADEAMGVTS